jgi:hydrogenase maturation factor
MKLSDDLLQSWLLEHLGSAIEGLTGAEASQAIQQLQADKAAVPA